MTIEELYSISQQHKKMHQCGGIPYEYGTLLTTLAAAVSAIRVLEVGTALGYTAACFAVGNKNVFVETIDQDATHLTLARKHWAALGLESQIDDHEGKAEEILPLLSGDYDIIFFDGYVPQVKMLYYFEQLLKVNGMLITANLFLRDKSGGKYLASLNQIEKWQTSIIADTAISVKRSLTLR